MSLQRDLQVVEIALADQILCHNSLTEVLGKVEQYVSSRMPRRINMDERVHPNVNKTSFPKQPRELSADEWINTVLRRVSHEKIYQGRPSPKGRVTDVTYVVRLMEREPAARSKKRYRFRNDLRWFRNVHKDQASRDEIEGLPG
jgi:hypothetical protein